MKILIYFILWTIQQIHSDLSGVCSSNINIKNVLMAGSEGKQNEEWKGSSTCYVSPFFSLILLIYFKPENS